VIVAAHPLKVICGRRRLMVEPREAGYPSTVQQDHEASIAEIDAGTRLLASESPRLRQAVLAVSRTHPLVTLRVDRVEVFDTAGIGLLLGLHRLARGNGAALVLARPTVRLSAALRRRGLHRVLVVEDAA
jgi:anti-anti-sigma factor